MRGAISVGLVSLVLFGFLRAVRRSCTGQIGIFVVSFGGSVSTLLSRLEILSKFRIDAHFLDSAAAFTVKASNVMVDDAVTHMVQKCANDALIIRWLPPA